MTPQEAAKKSLQFMATRVQGTGGLIVLDAKGRSGIYKTSEAMTWAQIQNESVESRPVIKYGYDLTNVITEAV